MYDWEVWFVMDNCSFVVHVKGDAPNDTLRSTAETFLVEQFGLHDWTSKVRHVYYNNLYTEEVY